MPVTFPHAPHVATVWVPELVPTHGTKLSTLAGLAICAIFLGTIAAMFAGVCLEHRRPKLTGLITALAFVALVAVVPGMRDRASGAAPIASAGTYPEQQDALTAARKAAIPKDAWRPVARRTSAPSSASTTWTQADLQALSTAVQRKAGVTAAFPGSQAVVDTTNMKTSDIAQSGTSYLTKDGHHQRCVAELSDVKTNNVGQPLSATLAAVRCAAAA